MGQQEVLAVHDFSVLSCCSRKELQLFTAYDKIVRTEIGKTELFPLGLLREQDAIAQQDFKWSLLGGNIVIVEFHFAEMTRDRYLLVTTETAQLVFSLIVLF